MFSVSEIFLCENNFLKDGWSAADRRGVDQEFWSATPMSDRLTSQLIIFALLILKSVILMIRFLLCWCDNADVDVELVASFWFQASGFLRGGNPAINSNGLHHWTPFASQTLTTMMLLNVDIDDDDIARWWYWQCCWWFRRVINSIKLDD